MAARTVDLVATGPPPSDPYDPTAPAWALASGFVAIGEDVRVVFPGSAPGEPPAGVRAVPVAGASHPGAAAEPAEWARLAARHLRPDAQIVVRDPLGLGTLGGRAPAHRRTVGVVRSLELTAFDRDRGGRPTAGVVDRLDAWRDRRTVRRLERQALAEVDRIVVDAPDVHDRLHDVYGIPASRMATVVPAVVPGPAPPSRAEARASVPVPNDVPVVVAPAAFDRPEPAGIDRSREAFRRIRPFFPGARLLVVGTDAPTDPGLVALPDRDAATYARALAAADVAIFARREVGFDPGVILALRAGVAPIVLPEVRLPRDPGDAVRRVDSSDPGDFASALAELVADPALRRTMGVAGREVAAAYDPSSVGAQVRAAALPVGR